MNSHLSEEQIARWMAGYADADAERHAGECPQCRVEAEKMQAALRTFRVSGYRCAEYWHAQPATGQALHARSLVFAGLAAALALLVLLSLAVSGLIHRPREQPPREVFVQIPYVVPAAPYERTAIVRMDVPVAALIAAGLQVRTAGVAGSVAADVLVGQDGRALAVSLNLTGEINQ